MILEGDVSGGIVDMNSLLLVDVDLVDNEEGLLGVANADTLEEVEKVKKEPIRRDGIFILLLLLLLDLNWRLMIRGDDNDVEFLESCRSVKNNISVFQ